MFKIYDKLKKKIKSKTSLLIKHIGLDKRKMNPTYKSMILIMFKMLNMIYPGLFLSYSTLSCFLFSCNNEEIVKNETMSNEDFLRFLLEHSARGAAKETIFFITGLVTAGVLGKNFWNGHETILQLILQNPPWVFGIYFIGMLSFVIYYNNLVNVDVELFPQLKKVLTEVPDGPTLLAALKRLIEESEKQ